MDKLFKISICSLFMYALFYICIRIDCVHLTWGMVYIYEKFVEVCICLWQSLIILGNLVWLTVVKIQLQIYQ